MRIDKYLAEHGFSSRTKAARALAKGLVTRNGKIAKASDEVAEGDVVEVRAEREAFAGQGVSAQGQEPGGEERPLFQGQGQQSRKAFLQPFAPKGLEHTGGCKAAGAQADQSGG